MAAVIRVKPLQCTEKRLTTEVQCICVYSNVVANCVAKCDANKALDQAILISQLPQGNPQ